MAPGGNDGAVGRGGSAEVGWAFHGTGKVSDDAANGFFGNSGCGISELNPGWNPKLYSVNIGASPLA